MNMKKILASVAASALAVTSLAAVASAIDLKGGSSTTYFAEVTYSKVGVAITAPSDISIAMPTVTGLSDGTVNITGASADVTVATQTTNVTKTKSNDGTAPLVFTTAVGNTTAKDFANCGDAETDYSAVITIKVKSTKPFTQAEGKFNFEGDANANFAKKGEDTITGVPSSGFSIGVGEAYAAANSQRISQKDYEAFNTTGATISLTFKGTDAAGAVGSESGKATAFATVKGVNYNAISALIAKDQSVTLTIDIPKGVLISKDDIDGGNTYNAITLTYSNLSADLIAASITANGTVVDGDDDDDNQQGGVEADDDDDDDTTTTTTTKPDDGNGSGNAGSDPNPGTGVVLAVIPAIVAASGVIVFKKRK